MARAGSLQLLEEEKGRGRSQAVRGALRRDAQWVLLLACAQRIAAVRCAAGCNVSCVAFCTVRVARFIAYAALHVHASAQQVLSTKGVRRKIVDCQPQQ